jgi:hypothetical protein
VHLVQARDLLAVLVLEQVDRLAPDDARDVPVAGGDGQALADEDLRIPAADAHEAQEAVVVDVGDDQPDLVDVADHGQGRAAGRAGHARPDRAHDVGRDLGVGRSGIAEDGGRRGLVARRAVRAEQRSQDGWDRHRAGP